MRRVFVAVVAMAAATIPAAAAAAAAKRHVHFTTRAVGAAISNTESAYKVRDSVFGAGAGVQIVKLNGTRGTDTTITYYGNAAARSKDSFSIGAPNANGIAKITGSGHDVSGTGKARGLKSSYTLTGTYDTKTTIFRVTLRGTYTF
jgi:hypothetical protein